MKKLVIYIIVLAFMGCATPLSKQKFPRDNVKDITVGKTTQRDVYDTFGEPIYHGKQMMNRGGCIFTQPKIILNLCLCTLIKKVV